MFGLPRIYLITTRDFPAMVFCMSVVGFVTLSLSMGVRSRTLKVKVVSSKPLKQIYGIGILKHLETKKR